MTKEFDEYLRCGILAHGFLQAKCEDCKHEKLVAFSCPLLRIYAPAALVSPFTSHRGFCPSCGARRMASTAVHFVEEVISPVPVRQLAPWTARSRAMQKQLLRVLSLPIPLESYPELLSPVLEVVHRVISGWLIKKAGLKRTEGQGGGVTFVQRFGSALNLNVHLTWMDEQERPSRTS